MWGEAGSAKERAELEAVRRWEGEERESIIAAQQRAEETRSHDRRKEIVKAASREAFVDDLVVNLIFFSIHSFLDPS